MRRTCSLVGVIAVVLTAAGCASLSVPLLGKKSEFIRATTENPVMDVLTIWESAEGRGPDNLPSRGFAGQLLFFTYSEATSAFVDGNVTIYVFDNQGSTEAQSKPLWQRTFTSEEWNCFARQTTLGVAYQLFVPYVRKGTHEAHCTLNVKFEPADGGPPVYSKSANVVLPGKKTEVARSSIRRERIEPQRFDAGGDTVVSGRGEDQLRGQLQSTTFTLPGQSRVSPAVAARLKQMAQEMVREQEQQSGVVQAGYVTEASESGDEDQDDPLTSGRRYRLH